MSCDHTADVCPIQIGCRCLEQLERVKVKKEGCCMSGRRPDGQTERRRSPNGYSCTTENTQHPAVHTPLPAPWQPASTDGGTAAGGNTAGVSMDDQCWSSHIQMRDTLEVESCPREKLLYDGRMAIGNHLQDRPSPRGFPPSSSLPPSHFLKCVMWGKYRRACVPVSPVTTLSGEKLLWMAGLRGFHWLAGCRDGWGIQS